MRALLGAGGNLDPGHGEVPGTEIAGIQEEVRAQAASLFDGRF